MAKLATAIFGFGVLALVVAILLPASINVTHTNASTAYQLTDGQTESVTTGLNITADNIRSGSVNYTLTDFHTKVTQSTNVSEGETNTVTVGGEDVSVTLHSTDGTTARTTIEYARTYGWDDRPKALVANLDAAIALVGFAAIMSGLAVIVS